MTDSQKLNKVEASTTKQPQVFAAELPKEVVKTVFRYLFSKENSLIELYPNPIIVRIKDIEELSNKIRQKVSQYDVHGASFDALATFENMKSEQYGSWDRFLNDEWSSPDVLDQLLLNWRFMIKFPNSERPASYVISVRLSSSLKPQHVIQAIFSKDPEDVDKIELELVPMSCRVDFVDPLLSQELMNIVSDWNKGRPSPEYIFPIMKKFKRHSAKIAAFVRYSVPALSVAACGTYYWTKTSNLELSVPASTAIVVNSVLWVAGTGAILFVTASLGYL